MTTTESEFFLRVAVLLVDGSCMVLRNLLKQAVEDSGYTLRNFLLSHQRVIFDLKRKRVFCQSIVDKLLPPASESDPDMDTFDLSLLCSLIIEMSNLGSAELDEVRKLRRFRNNVYAHVQRASLDVQQFGQHWSDISSCILNLSKHVTDPRFESNMKSFISRTEKGPLEITSAIENIKTWYANDIKQLKRTLQELADSSKESQAKIQKLENSDAQVRQNLQVLDQRVLQLESTRETDTNSRENAAKALKAKLLDIYTQSFTSVPLSPMDDNNAVSLSDLYTEGDIKEKQTASTQRKGFVKSYYDIFFRKTKRVKSAYLVGQAGYGKTTWCKQVVNVWCQAHRRVTLGPTKGQTVPVVATATKHHNEDTSVSEEDKRCMLEFEYLFFVPLKFASDKSSVIEAFCSTILEQSPQFHETVKDVLRQFPEKVLIICDGLDEHESALSQEHLNGCSILTTTRPWKYDKIKSGKYKADLTLEMQGLNIESIERLTAKVLNLVYGSSDQEMVDNFFDSIHEADLFDILKIPQMLIFITLLWVFWGELPPSVTQSVLQILVCIVQAGCERLTNVEELEEKWGMETLPGLFADKEELQPYGGLLLSLAKLAFDCLISPEQSNSLVFKGKSLLKYFKHLPEKELQACLNLGLLSKSEVSTFLKRETEITFYHKTFQDLFAAIWIAHCQEDFKKMCGICRSIEKVLDMENICTFLCGIDPSLGLQFSQHLSQVNAQVALRWRESHFSTEESVNFVEEDYDDEDVDDNNMMMSLTKEYLSFFTEMSHTSKAASMYVTDVHIDHGNCNDFSEYCDMLQDIKTNVTYLVIGNIPVDVLDLAEVVPKLSALEALKIQSIYYDDEDESDTDGSSDSCASNDDGLTTDETSWIETRESSRHSQQQDSDMPSAFSKTGRTETNVVGLTATESAGQQPQEKTLEESNYVQQKDTAESPEPAQGSASTHISESLPLCFPEGPADTSSGLRPPHGKVSDNLKKPTRMIFPPSDIPESIDVTKDGNCQSQKVMGKTELQNVQMANSPYQENSEKRENVKDSSQDIPANASNQTSESTIFCSTHEYNEKNDVKVTIGTEQIRTSSSSLPSQRQNPEVRCVQFPSNLKVVSLIDFDLDTWLIDFSASRNIETLCIEKIEMSSNAWGYLLSCVQRLQHLQNFALIQENSTLVETENRCMVQMPAELKTLHLRLIDFGDSLLDLSLCKQLKSLRLSAVMMCPPAWKHLFCYLGSLGCLQQFIWTQNYFHPVHFKDSVSIEMPRQLKTLQLRYIDFDDSQLNLNRCKNLEKLVMKESTMSCDSWVSLFECINSMRRLRYLRLMNCQNVTTTAIKIPTHMSEQKKFLRSDGSLLELLFKGNTV